MPHSIYYIYEVLFIISTNLSSVGQHHWKKVHKLKSFIDGAADWSKQSAAPSIKIFSTNWLNPNMICKKMN